jgi:hypothetical protein
MKRAAALIFVTYLNESGWEALFKVVKIYEFNGVTVMADVEFNGVVKRIQRDVFNAYTSQKLLNLASCEYDGIEDFILTFGGNAEAVLSEYVNEMLGMTRFIEGLKVLDLRGSNYRGGTTLSVGHMPRWDIGKFSIKVCDVDKKSMWLNDALNESYVMDLFEGAGVEIAKVVPALVLFFNESSNRDEIRMCAVSVKPDSYLSYFSDLRWLRGYGEDNDDVFDLMSDFPLVAAPFLNMIAVDLLINQTERHLKDWGVLSDGRFAPLYNNGRSLHYDVADEMLGNANFSLTLIDGIKDVNSVGSAMGNNFKTYLRYRDWMYKWQQLKPSINFERVLSNLNRIETRFYGLLPPTRLVHNRNLIERRVRFCEQI